MDGRVRGDVNASQDWGLIGLMASNGRGWGVRGAVKIWNGGDARVHER